MFGLNDANTAATALNTRKANKQREAEVATLDALLAEQRKTNEILIHLTRQIAHLHQTVTGTSPQPPDAT